MADPIKVVVAWILVVELITVTKVLGSVVEAQLRRGINCGDSGHSNCYYCCCMC